jgi:hypothetical protein
VKHFGYWCPTGGAIQLKKARCKHAIFAKIGPEFSNNIFLNKKTFSKISQETSSIVGFVSRASSLISNGEPDILAFDFFI